MPSELRMVDETETVQCRMVNGTLPAAVCDQEQGVHECTGCTASSRRCTACGRASGIANAENGWCERCVEKKGGPAMRVAPPEGTQDEQLETVFDRVRKMGSWKIATPVTVQLEADAIERIKVALGQVASRGGEIVRDRYGLDGSTPLSFEAIGAKYGITRQRAHQVFGGVLEVLHAKGIPLQELETLKRTASLEREEEPHGSRQQRDEMVGSPLLKDPSRLYAALMEHGAERDGMWSVHAPVQILMSRFHLLREEAVQVLDLFSVQRSLEGSLPWNEAVLLKTDGIKELKEKTESTGRERGPYGPKRKPSTAQTRSAPQPPTPPVLSAVRSDASSLLANLPSMRPVATYGEIYADLLKRSYNVKGERVIPGARPSLQIRFKLSQQQAVETLEWFKANGHVRQKDEWRTIILVSDKVESAEGPARNAKQGGKTVTAPRPQPTPTTVPPVSIASVSKPPRPPSSLSNQTPGSAGHTLAQIERALPKLREQREAIDQSIAKLEAMAVELRRLETSAQVLLSSLNVRDDS